MSNRLAQESSPYLLQHANNPVDWYPWGDAAFARARLEDKPIFLSIGYSTCHWCHVMEHESFERQAVADVLNAHFVSIKVDREERPDVDRVYMTFVQATTGSGGWPMSVFLTPELKPFYGGTYFPPESRWGRPGFVDVLQELTRVWREERSRVLGAAEELMERLRHATEAGHAEAEDGEQREPGRTPGGIILVGGGDLTDPSGAPLGIIKPKRPVADEEALEEGAVMFRHAFDPRHGGFGDAPKFPRASELYFLLREFARTGDGELKDLTLATLRAMALGGMRDHVGGGFHRYSVDAAWRVPHFEKMLYDQGQLALAYLEAAQASGEGFYAMVAEDTLVYVQRDMTDAEGGFYSAEDADSVPPETAAAGSAGTGDAAAHKMEGAFYIWADAEIAEIVGEADAPVVRARFGIEPGGNAPHDPQGEFTGKNLLYTAASIEDIAQRTGRSVDDVIDVLGRARQQLFEARATRPRPHLDDKILTAWNGLMIAAFARAARVLDGVEGAEEAAVSYRESAEKAAAFVRRVLWREDSRTLLRRYRAGNAAIEAYSEDYAFLNWGVLELFEATGAAEWLEWALTLQARQDELFWDDADGGWFNTTGRDPSVLLRMKEEYDGAEPAASSLAVRNALQLAHLTGDAGALEKAERTLARFGQRIGAAGRAVPFMLSNLSAWHAGPRQTQIVLVGPRDREDTRALRSVLTGAYLPFATVIPVDTGADDAAENQAALARLLPWVGAMGLVDGRAAAYVCRNFACERPVTDPAALADTIRTGLTRSVGALRD
jgi:uncharacterized protein YyaL (SSP411 family)